MQPNGTLLFPAINVTDFVTNNKVMSLFPPDIVPFVLKCRIVFIYVVFGWVLWITGWWVRRKFDWRFSFAASTVALGEQEQLFSVGVLGVWKCKSCWRFRVENGANGVGVLGSLNTALLHHFFQLFWLLHLLSLLLSWV